jgi:ribosomal protein S18 acetylase RimI-like enzyme
MKFIVDSTENLHISDDEIFDLLSQVYVQAGFISAEIAKTVFDPVKVRDRGGLFVSQELSKNEFSGMVIVVPPKSKAIIRAKENECEMHLLGVSPKHRGYGLGRRLVSKAIDFAKDNNWSKMILWTQKPMKEAQNLYESSGFVRTGEMTKNDIEFFVYERKCT